MSFTVPELVRLLGVEASDDLHWSIGNAAQRRFAAAYGRQPPKDNFPKTNGGGSHCFAVYPDDFRPVVEELIREHKTEESRQADLFGESVE